MEGSSPQLAQGLRSGVEGKWGGGVDRGSVFVALGALRPSVCAHLLYPSQEKHASCERFAPSVRQWFYDPFWHPVLIESSVAQATIKRCKRNRTAKDRVIAEAASTVFSGRFVWLAFGV